MDCPNSQPVDPRVKRTKKLLQDAMRELLKEKRLSAISVLDITERATVNRATFYAHFDDKQVLMSSILRADFEKCLRSQMPDCASFSMENVQTVATTVYRFLGEIRGGCPEAAVEIDSIIGTTLQEGIYAMIYHWAKKDDTGELSGFSGEAIATVASWAIFGGAYQWVQGDRKISAEKHSQELVSLIFRKAA